MDNKPPPRAWQWSTLSHSVCFLDLTTLLLIRFRHLYQFPIPFNQTMVQVRVQPLYSMASSIAHDFFRQEANPLHLLCVLKSSRAWRHSDATHVPLVTRLHSRCWLKNDFFHHQTYVRLLFSPCPGLRVTWCKSRPLIGWERSREQIDDVSYANESRDLLKQ